MLLLEKAFAKCFQSHCQIQGDYCMVSVMLLVECNAPCRVFTQAMNGRVPFNDHMYQGARNRNSIGLAPTVQISTDQVRAELKAADASNHVMAAWTGKDCFH